MKRYAFTNAEGRVVQAISGSLNESQRAQFLRDYAILFGATSAIELADDAVRVWIGGTYTPEEGFLPPPPPPEPEVIEGTSEELTPLIEEIISE